MLWGGAPPFILREQAPSAAMIWTLGKCSAKANCQQHIYVFQVFKAQAHEAGNRWWMVLPKLCAQQARMLCRPVRGCVEPTLSAGRGSWSTFPPLFQRSCPGNFWGIPKSLCICQDDSPATSMWQFHRSFSHANPIRVWIEWKRSSAECVHKSLAEEHVQHSLRPCWHASL